MSTLGNLGLGFGPTGGGSCDYPAATAVTAGTTYGFGAFTGNVTLPTQAEVQKGTSYGANGTQYLGTLVRSGGVVRLIRDTGKPTENTLSDKRVATQGVNPWDLIANFRNYVRLTTGLQERFVVTWFGETRPHLNGMDFFVWFRPVVDVPEKAEGPSRWGNKSNVRMELHLVMRNYADSSQVDAIKAKQFYETHWKLEQALQGTNLFDAYTAPPKSGLWFPPQPDTENNPLTVEPMFLGELPVPNKTQREEATLEGILVVNLPVILALTVP